VKALVVDDTIVVREVIAEALERLGLQMQIAGSVGEARERLDASHAFAMVDMNLPDGCGLDLAPQTIDLKVPLIAMSGDPDALEDALGTHGVVAVLAKPFGVAALRRIVSPYLSPNPWRS
jgi:CheY-like chemotaxis protein